MADEIWGFVGSKQANTPHNKQKVQGDIWVWIATCRTTKLVPCWYVGHRSGHAARAFMLNLAGRVGDKVQLSSDAFSAYAQAVEGAFVAYKHPKAYKKIWTPLMICYCVVFICAIVWNTGVNFTFRALDQYIAADKSKEAIEAFDSNLIPVWIILAAVGLYFYLFILTFLPNILDEEKPK